MSVRAITAEQQAKWEQQRQYVLARSLFYQALWQGQSVPTKLSAIAKLPLSDKSQLRAAQQTSPPFGHYLAADAEKVCRLHRTSGTTGQAMNLALSARDAEQTAVVGGRCQSLAGLSQQHRVVHCLNYQLWMGGLTDHLTLEKNGAMVIPFGVGSTDKLIRTIKELGINAISCTPSYPAVLEKHLQEHFPQLAPRDLGLRLGLFGGEPGLDDPGFRHHLEATWGMAARNSNYGVTDVMCNFASQCPGNPDLHFMADDVLHVELIDPESTQVLDIREGTEGELVLTHLARECQPLVRFRTGDIVTITATSRCTCGHEGFRFRVIGRSDDMIVVRGINVFPSALSAAIRQINPALGDYRIVLDTPPPYDVLPLQIEKPKQPDSSKVQSGGQLDDAALVMTIIEGLKRELGVTASVTLLPPDTLPLTEGKTQRIIRTYSV